MENDTRERARGAPIGDFYGHVEAVAPNVWRWPFRHMQQGDWFTVSALEKPIGTVRNAATQAGYRLNKRFSVTGDGETITVTCEAPLEEGGRTPAQIAADKAILVGGDGDKYLGILEPPEKAQWAWPFGRMEPGQYFHVRHSDRHPERVRQLAMVRAAQLAIKISVKADDPDLPGYCRVEYVDITKTEGQQDVSFKAMDQLLHRCYGIGFSDLRVEYLQDRMFQPASIPAERFEKPRFDAYVMQEHVMAYALELKEHEIVVTGLPKGTTFAKWQGDLDVDPLS